MGTLVTSPDGGGMCGYLDDGLRRMKAGGRFSIGGGEAVFNTVTWSICEKWMVAACAPSRTLAKHQCQSTPTTYHTIPIIPLQSNSTHTVVRDMRFNACVPLFSTRMQLPLSQRLGRFSPPCIFHVILRGLHILTNLICVCICRCFELINCVIMTLFTATRPKQMFTYRSKAFCG